MRATVKTIAKSTVVAIAILGAAALGFSAGSNASGTTDGQTIMMAAGIAACIEEDGSSPAQQFPCEWNADTRANHLGVSFILNAPLGDEDPATVVGAN